MRVLIVDDSAVARRALAKRLATEGHEVIEAATAAEARAIAIDGVGCAVLDLELGDGNGVDVADALRSRSAALPIAFFTGVATSVLAARATTRGPVFTKPDDLDVVVAWVARVPAS